MIAFTLFACVCAGLLLDLLFGEARRFHPLVGFGNCANSVENLCRKLSNDSAYLQFLGLLAWLLLVLAPALALFMLLAQLPLALQLAVDVIVLYFTIGLQSLKQHAQAVLKPLLVNDLEAARQKVGLIVSRDTAALDEQGVVNATVETVLENGSDGVLAPIFWFLLLGAPGALLYRFANTLDAMWGYKNARYNEFGWVSAKLDDALNYFPARLAALSYALAGHFSQSIQAAKQQGPLTESPNAGFVMAAGAGAVGVVIGGATKHQGKEHWRPVMGCGEAARATDIRKAISLLNRAVTVWIVVIGLFAFAFMATVVLMPQVFAS